MKNIEGTLEGSSGPTGPAAVELLLLFMFSRWYFSTIISCSDLITFLFTLSTQKTKNRISAVYHWRTQFNNIRTTEPRAWTRVPTRYQSVRRRSRNQKSAAQQTENWSKSSSFHKRPAMLPNSLRWPNRTSIDHANTCSLHVIGRQNQNQHDAPGEAAASTVFR